MAYTIKFWDKGELVVTTEQGEKIQQALLTDTGIEMIKIGDNIYKKSAIVSVVKGGHLPPDPNQKQIGVPETPEITDEMRAKNLEKLAEIRREFNRRREERQAKLSEFGMHDTIATDERTEQTTGTEANATADIPAEGQIEGEETPSVDGGTIRETEEGLAEGGRPSNSKGDNEAHLGES